MITQESIEFIKDIALWLENNCGGRFVYKENLMVGEIVRDSNGVYLQSEPSPEPDRYTPLEKHVISFNARNTDPVQAYEDLRYIYNLLDRRRHYQTTNYDVHYSIPQGQILDLDRDGNGGKLLKLSVLFINTTLIS